jgi:hypothetical protein
MGTRTAYALELRHNDEPVGRVTGGAVDVHYDVVHGDARFWLGLRGLRSRVTLGGPPLPRPRRHFVPLVVR